MKHQVTYLLLFLLLLLLLFFSFFLGGGVVLLGGILLLLLLFGGGEGGGCVFLKKFLVVLSLLCSFVFMLHVRTHARTHARTHIHTHSHFPVHTPSLWMHLSSFSSFITFIVFLSCSLGRCFVFCLCCFSRAFDRCSPLIFITVIISHAQSDAQTHFVGLFVLLLFLLLLGEGEGCCSWYWQVIRLFHP